MLNKTPASRTLNLVKRHMTQDNLKQLREPFPSANISWRVGAKSEDGTRGQALPYIDARDVQNRLDDTVGPGNWRNRFTEVIADGRIIAVRCVLSLKVDGEWVDKEDAAQLDSYADSVRAEVAIKGVYSDAEKRAAVQWGIGRYLYDFDAPWVDLSESGRLQRPPTLPSEMLPEAERAIVAARQAAKQAAKTASDATAQANADAMAQAQAEADAAAAASKAERAQTQADAAAQAEADAAAAQADAKAKAQAKAQADADAAKAQADADAAKAQAEAQAKAANAPAQADSGAAQGDDSDRRASTDALVDQAAARANSQPAASADSDELPADTPDDQRALVADLLEKMKKLPATMIRSYVNGPKGQEKLSPNVREYLLKVLAAREATA